MDHSYVSLSTNRLIPVDVIPLAARPFQVSVLVASSHCLEFASGWHFCVPSSFRAALDINLTPRKVNGRTVMKWTQGSWFHFEEGDTLYDSRKAYLPWDLRNFHICLDIRRASPAQPPNGTDRTTRHPGVVIFDVLTPNEEATQLVNRRKTTMSQDEFVNLLIIGPPPEWNDFLT